MYISPVLLVAVSLVTILPLVLSHRMNAKLKQRRDKFSLQMAAYTQQLKELLSGFELIRAFLRENAYDSQHCAAAHQAEKEECSYQQSLNAVIVNTSLISNLIFPIILLVGLLLVFENKITLGTMSTAASMANFVVTPCNLIAQNYAKLKSTKGIRSRLEAAMSGTDDTESGGELAAIEEVKCEHVGFAYPGAADAALKDISLCVERGQKIALVGESGGGKSTLAKLLFQYYPDYSGHIRFNGQEVRDIRRTSLYSHVGYIAQKTMLFNDTLRSNICLQENFTDEQLARAVETAGLASWVSTLPDGLDTVISENGKNLSGGQCQRIGIARLALRQYDLVIADEITSSLDPDTAQQVMENLLSLPCMAIVITHDVSGAFMQKFDGVYKI